MRKTNISGTALLLYNEKICPPSGVHCGNNKVDSVGLQICVCTVREQGYAVASGPGGGSGSLWQRGHVCLCSTWRDTKAETVTLRVLTALFN